MPPLLRRLGAACPRLDLILVEDTTDRLLDALDRGDLDAAVIATQEPAPGREDNILYHEAFLAAVHARSDLAGGQGVTTAHLLESELLLLTDGHCLRDQALEVCGRFSYPWPTARRRAPCGLFPGAVFRGRRPSGR